MRYTWLAGLLAFLVMAAGPAAANKLSLKELSRYLNGIKTAQSPFTQVNDDGSLDTGVLYMHRPGRMRFDYNPPNDGVVIAGAGAVIVHDEKSNQPPESYPLKRTPLSIILARNVNLGRANMVVGHTFDGTATVVTAQDPEHPEYGRIEMMFTANPTELRKWVIYDGDGMQTSVVLGELKTGVRLSSTLFSTDVSNASSNR
jgi:outer membrane lipoprotein-sorting protein